MRLRSVSNVALTLVTAGTLVASSPAPHAHKHAHANKRVYTTVDVPGPTVIAYELNGKPIDQSEVCQGINDGSLKWADSADIPPECASSTATPTSPESTSFPELQTSITSQVASQNAAQTLTKASVSSPSSSTTTFQATSASSSFTKLPVAAKTTQTSSPAITSSKFQSVTVPIAASSSATQTSSTGSGASSSKIPASSSAAQASSSASTSIATGQGLELEFPDGTIDCATFPSDYGPIEVEWAQLGGWSGIQYVTIEGDVVTHIDTAVPGGDGCKPGAMCSYACPPGYQKSQWPSTQGATGQSVGGLSCNSDGKLTLTNAGLSRNLCIQGTGAVNVQNKLSSNAAICRTDYPGTENEVVPLNTQPESTSPLTCPDASSYFKHDGASTTAQYYINNQGVAVQSACIWGSDGTDMGNWAPSYLGVGQDVNGKTWLSIASTAQNDPTNYKPLNFTVKITGDTSGNCGLSNGRYCSGDNYDDCNDLGCTVELMSGKALYVLEDGSNLFR